MNRFTDRVVVVTGGGAGIGRAAAVGFADEGARVLVTGRRADPLKKLSEVHANISFALADVGSPADARRTIEDVVGRFGRIDVLVNNAGDGALLPLESASAERISRILAVNVAGPSLLAAAAIPELRRSHGCIVNVSSTFGHKAAAGLSHYAASKAALEHLTRCWALEFAGDGVRVNAVAAGPTETSFLVKQMGLSETAAEDVRRSERQRIPLGRRGTPDDIARWILALASDDASWITGQVLAVDGGLSIT